MSEPVSVSARFAGYSDTRLTYEVLGYDSASGELAGGFAIRILLPVVEEKVLLHSVEFTSDHNLMRKNGVDLLRNDGPGLRPGTSTSGLRYPNIEFNQTPGLTKSNAPISHTIDQPDKPQKIKAKVTIDVASLPAAQSYKLVGVGNEDAVSFEKVFAVPPQAKTVTVDVEAKATVGTLVRVIRSSITWTVEATIGVGNTKQIPAGVSGVHSVYLTFGTPQIQDDPARTVYRITPLRMDVAVPRMAAAQAEAIRRKGAQYTTTRLVQELMNLHYMDTREWAGNSNANARWAAWEVPGPFYPTSSLEFGGDCTAGVAHAQLVLAATGVPGKYELKAYIPKSKANYDIAKEFNGSNWDKQARFYPKLGEVLPQRLQLIDRYDFGHNFEATLIYSLPAPPGVVAPKFYFPAGFRDAVYDAPNPVLWVFQSAIWVWMADNGRGQVEGLPYTKAVSVGID